ncbi:MAG TPA: helix-turn-helix domain-containing protein [Chloroflexota bacterium]
MGGIPSNDDGASLENLGAFIRQRRMALDLTQTQLADRLGWVQERISSLERGRYGLPSLPGLARLAAALQTPLAELLAAAGYKDVLSDPTVIGEPATSAALLYTLEQLLSIPEIELHAVLAQASSMIAAVMGADKIDAFFVDAQNDSLVALGTSDTPMGIRELELGLDRIPLVGRSPEVEAFETGQPYYTGNAEQEGAWLDGIVDDLGVRSVILVPLEVAGERVGILAAASAQPDRFSAEDRSFFATVARWIGMVAHRAQLIDVASGAGTAGLSAE